jgi:hypothetical protein
MSRKRIVCINKKPYHQDPYTHITQVGIGTNDGWSEKLDVQTVINQLRQPLGDRYYVRGSDGSEADVRLGKCLHCGGHTYIRTTPDHSLKDNLLSLVECVN